MVFYLHYISEFWNSLYLAKSLTINVGGETLTLGEFPHGKVWTGEFLPGKQITLNHTENWNLKYR